METNKIRHAEIGRDNWRSIFGKFVTWLCLTLQEQNCLLLKYLTWNSDLLQEQATVHQCHRGSENQSTVHDPIQLSSEFPNRLAAFLCEKENSFGRGSTYRTTPIPSSLCCKIWFFAKVWISGWNLIADRRRDLGAAWFVKVGFVNWEERRRKRGYVWVGFYS